MVAVGLHDFKFVHALGWQETVAPVRAARWDCEAFCHGLADCNGFVVSGTECDLKRFANDACLCRYLRARAWNLKKALKMFSATARWRERPQRRRSRDVGGACCRSAAAE